MSEISELISDTRKIEAVYYDDAEGSHYKINETGVSDIVAYAEPGIYGIVPWLKIMVDRVVIARLPAWKVTVVYAEGQGDA